MILVIIGLGNGMAPVHKCWLIVSKIQLNLFHRKDFWANVFQYRQTSNIGSILVGYKIVGHSDVAGELPVGTAPTTSSFSTQHLASVDWIKTTARQDEKHLSFGIWCDLY